MINSFCKYDPLIISDSYFSTLSHPRLGFFFVVDPSEFLDSIFFIRYNRHYRVTQAAQRTRQWYPTEMEVAEHIPVHNPAKMRCCVGKMLASSPPVPALLSTILLPLSETPPALLHHHMGTIQRLIESNITANVPLKDNNPSCTKSHFKWVISRGVFAFKCTTSPYQMLTLDIYTMSLYLKT